MSQILRSSNLYTFFETYMKGRGGIYFLGFVSIKLPKSQLQSMPRTYTNPTDKLSIVHLTAAKKKSKKR